MLKGSDIQIQKRTVRYLFIAVCLVAFALLTFWFRTLPVSQIATEHWASLIAVGCPDVWFSLRQIEQIVTHFPSYSWFDPMTGFPDGRVVHWGPLYPLMASVLVLLMGASTRPEMMYVASFLSPLMAVAMVPVMYGLGAKLVDWKTGLVSAGFISIVAGQYAYRSLYSFIDHHITETLFSALFCLCFIIAMMKLKESGVRLTDLESLKNPVLIYPALAGFAFLLGMYNMGTMLVFLLLVAVYTLIQMIVDHIRKQETDYLVVTNAVTFFVVIIGLIPFGLVHTGFGLGRYNVGNLLLALFVIIGSLLLYAISRYLADRPWYYYPASLAGLCVISWIVGNLALPTVFGAWYGRFSSVVGMGATTLTVQEAMPWQFANAVSVFNWGWILVAGGVLYLLYLIWKRNDAPALFTLVWFALILFMTMRQVRFEYYLAANIALMAAICVGAVMQIGGRDLLRLTGIAKFLKPKDDAVPPEDLPDIPEKPGKKGQKQKKDQQKRKERKKAPAEPPASPLRSGLLVVTVLIALLFVHSGASANYTIGTNVREGINSDWLVALTWLGENSPDPGVDYYEIYDSPQARDVFEYPPEAYGVLSWWDYGHWITFVSKRIPVANPFQQNARTSAHFFMETDVDAASAMLDDLGVRYIITDIEMTTGKFWAMATWHDPVNATGHFQKRVLYEESAGSYSQVQLQRESYFQTMIQRLHAFDGSAVVPEQILVVQSAPANELGIADTSTPVIIGVGETESVDEARAYIAEFEKTAPAGQTAEILSPEMFVSSTELDALPNIRLVYESPTNVLRDGGDIRYVKVFEVVPGAVLEGEGMIEVPVETNTGRTFTYRQESRDGVFVLPYPTEAGPDDVVVATGPYRIVETGQEVSVPYQAVIEGLRI
ncbi:MAG: oligosaccharyl transferase, archaeosortase A system-associated [Methanocalculus sp. MSAO_Arc1]|uniref:oligosaccharyl transferase, archaeosortase A system-associated n=1 Tax=Methanocalculus TaxID=71151 RepID=UPI000FF0F109|nr:oligosaccharyl transferase, archaeosortase A system-associated [Methanocalculus sp. MSAO_Arc1]RQD80965.1 MAG: oligosaccharyl transferase, archaeosortase A system-associated [Methanocalculus sp. MSAO_Arc1]